MKIETKYTASPTLDEKSQILKLLDGAFKKNIYSRNTEEGFFSGYTCDYTNFVLLKNNDEVTGVAIVTKRKINFLMGQVNAISIGPVAIKFEHQGKGLSKRLIDGICILAEQLEVAILYLQGIDDFYNKYDFYTCCSKSKLIFQISEFESNSEISIEPLTKSNVDHVIAIYNNTASFCSCTCVREKRDWDWLIKYASNTWYFYKPTIVLNNDVPIGYFCSDPEEPSRIREAIFDNSDFGIQSFFSGLKIYGQENSIEGIEIMTWINSPVYLFTKQHFNAQFNQFFKRNGSQMMKILNFEILVNMLFRNLSTSLATNSIEEGLKDWLVNVDYKGKCYPLKIHKRLVPGLFCGFYDTKVIQEFENFPDELRNTIEQFFDKLPKPFFFQGDNL